MIVVNAQAARQHRGLDAAPCDLDLLSARKIALMVDLAQRQHGHADRPQAKFTDAGFTLWDKQGVGQCVLQVRMCDGDEVRQFGREI